MYRVLCQSRICHWSTGVQLQQLSGQQTRLHVSEAVLHAVQRSHVLYLQGTLINAHVSQLDYVRLKLSFLSAR